jgi:hypothetical protein
MSASWSVEVDPQRGTLKLEGQREHQKHKCRREKKRWVMTGRAALPAALVLAAVRKRMAANSKSLLTAHAYISAMKSTLPRHLRLAATILCCVGVAGCAASREEVAARLGAEYVGKNVDTLVAKFGPPTSMFKMNSGQTSYQWQLSDQTNIAVDRGYGYASTRIAR